MFQGYEGELLALLTALIWSFAVILFKKSGENVHVVTLSLFKAVLAFTLFIPTALIIGAPLLVSTNSSDLFILILSGILGLTIADTIYFYSLNKLGAGLGSIINCLYSPTIILMSVIFLGERLTVMQVAGTALIVVGIAVATGRREGRHLTSRDLFLGFGAGILAVVTSAAGIILMKPILERSPLIWVSEVRLAAGAVGLLIYLAFHPKRASIIGSLKSKSGLGYTAAGSFVGAYLALIPWAAGFKFGDASTTAALQQTNNLFVFIWALIFLKEPLTVRRVLGITFGMAGIFLVTFG